MRWFALPGALGLALLGCRINFDELPDTTCTPAVEVTALSSGRDFTCAVLAGGDVRCWGAGEAGQLGDGGRATRLDPVAPAGLAPATMVSAGMQHACAVVAGGVWCWGRNDAGQLGLGDRITHDVPTQVGMLPGDVVGVSAGGLHTCAWTQAGELYCWGQGDGLPAESSSTPVRVTGVPAIAKVATSSRDALFSANHACALGADGSAWCWGDNAWGQLGIDDGSVTRSATPRRVVTPLVFADLGVGLGHTCGRTADGVVACWGLAVDGELGDGGTQDRPAPVVIAVPPSVELAVSSETTCSRDAEGGVLCWGDNDREQLARSGPDGLVPERIALPPVRALGVGETHACAITGAGVVLCWGGDRAGQRSGLLSTSAVIVDANAEDIAAGGDSTCARSADGRLRCWGHGAFGQLGDGTRTSRGTPVDTGLASVTAVSVGDEHACARLADGSVTCWGSNENDRVQFGGAVDYASPALVTGIGIAPLTVTAGGGHTCVLGAGPTPWCWGNTDEGTFGRGVGTPTSAPLATNFANVTSISAGGNHTCVVTSAMRVFCAGRDNEGQIGRADNMGDVYVPLEVTGAPSAIAVDAGRKHTCAIGAGGTGWCWGNNVTYQVGDGTDLVAEEPTPLTVTGLVEIAAGVSHTCARDQANDVWCWGANTSGQLGDGTTTTRQFPTRATELTGAVQLAVGASHTCARMADKTVRCVGARDNGQTGGGAVQAPSPLPAQLTCPRAPG